jgi:hypothetical protein
VLNNLAPSHDNVVPQFERFIQIVAHEYDASPPTGVAGPVSVCKPLADQWIMSKTPVHQQDVGIMASALARPTRCRPIASGRLSRY